MTGNEVGGFGITETDDLLFITDFALVKQNVTFASVSFDDTAVADFFDSQVDLGKKPEQFARVWIHCHPGNCPKPSFQDEETFERVFGNCDWAVMFIIAMDNSVYARLRFNTGPGGKMEIPVEVDYQCEFDAADFDGWEKQYISNIFEEKILPIIPVKAKSPKAVSEDIFGCDGSENITAAFDCYKVLDELEAMEPMEREMFMQELAIRSEFWDEYERKVLYD
jgi:hypothetical protein